MRSVNSIQSLWAGFSLSVVLAVAGCGQPSTPQSQFVTDGDSPASISPDDVSSEPSGPLSTNDFDSQVVTTAGELPSLTPKTKAAAKPITPLSEEAQEDPFRGVLENRRGCAVQLFVDA